MEKHIFNNVFRNRVTPAGDNRADPENEIDNSAEQTRKGSRFHS
jgi:hypothetical protein